MWQLPRIDVSGCDRCMLQGFVVRLDERARRLHTRPSRRLRCPSRERNARRDVRDEMRVRVPFVHRHERHDLSGAVVRPRGDVLVQAGRSRRGQRLRLLAVVVPRHGVLRADELARGGPRVHVRAARLQCNDGRLLLPARRHAAFFAVVHGGQLLRHRRGMRLPAQLLRGRAHRAELRRAHARYRPRLCARPEARRELLDSAVITARRWAD